MALQIPIINLGNVIFPTERGHQTEKMPRFFVYARKRLALLIM